jgi:DNA adenine methylase
MVGPIAYVGGKNRFATKIIPLFPEHTTYVEPFAGGAQLFFHKQPSPVEVLNDLDFEVVNFFRVCQWHYQELVRLLEYVPVSRKLHALMLNTMAETLTDVQRAARFLYLQKTSFGGLILNQKYHYGVTQPPNYNPTRIPELIKQTHQRLERVQIESLPYEQILEKYDRPTSFYYIDPPYFQRKLYKFNFSEADFQRLQEQLARVRGKFILSINDAPAIRKMFSRFRIDQIEVAYTAKKNTEKRFSELLIMNFEPTVSVKSLSESKREKVELSGAQGN